MTDVEAATPILGGSSEPSCSVLLFDGECNLCNTTVDFLLRLDKGSDPVRVKFASLQSPQARTLLGARGLAPESFVAMADPRDETVVFVSATGAVHVRSAAILHVLAVLVPWWGRWACLAPLLVPACARDAVYKQVARNRIRLFGKKDTCRRATKEDKRHFLCEHVAASAPGSAGQQR